MKERWPVAGADFHPAIEDQTPVRILLATDAWHPQINGVVRTYSRLIKEARELGAEIVPFTHEGRPTFPLPSYPQVRLALVTSAAIAETFERIKPDFVHIATEGTIGLAARTFCVGRAMPFTTSFHTKFPDYISARFPVPLAAGYMVQRWFHNSGAGMMVATPSLADELRGRDFQTIMSWTRGVDTELFRPRPVSTLNFPRPIQLYVGRVAVEKNLEAFLKLETPGTKVVIGEGPSLDDLTKRYPDCRFLGAKTGEALAAAYASADVFVFPSVTDTFGVVILEAMASGLPVAAFPVTGPVDIVEDGVSGALDHDLARAIERALELSQEAARARALTFSWRACARLFLANIVAANRRAGHRPLKGEAERRIEAGEFASPEAVY